MIPRINVQYIKTVRANSFINCFKLHLGGHRSILCDKMDGAFYNILERSHCFLKLCLYLAFFIIEKRFFDILFLL